jgi:hypothetical protein
MLGSYKHSFQINFKANITQNGSKNETSLSYMCLRIKFCIRGCFALISFLKKCSSHCTPLVKHCTMLGRFSPSSCDQHICVPSVFNSHFICIIKYQNCVIIKQYKENTYVRKEKKMLILKTQRVSTVKEKKK